MNKTTRFYHLHLPTGGVITGAAIRATNGIINIGFAFCSPNDRFVKKMGRAISLGRAQKVPYQVSGTHSTDAMKQILYSLIDGANVDQYIFGKASIPRWVSKRTLELLKT